MTEKVTEAAQNLQNTIKETDAFKDLSEKYNALHEDKDAYEIFKDFQKNQDDLRQKQMAGEQISEEDMKGAQELATKMNTFDTIKNLMESEKAMGQMIDDANMLITQPLRDLYNS